MKALQPQREPRVSWWWQLALRCSLVWNEECVPCDCLAGTHREANESITRGRSCEVVFVCMGEACSHFKPDRVRLLELFSCSVKIFAAQALVKWLPFLPRFSMWLNVLQRVSVLGKNAAKRTQSAGQNSYWCRISRCWWRWVYTFRYCTSKYYLFACHKQVLADGIAGVLSEPEACDYGQIAQRDGDVPAHYSKTNNLMPYLRLRDCEAGTPVSMPGCHVYPIVLADDVIEPEGIQSRKVYTPDITSIHNTKNCFKPRWWTIPLSGCWNVQLSDLCSFQLIVAWWAKLIWTFGFRIQELLASRQLSVTTIYPFVSVEEHQAAMTRYIFCPRHFDILTDFIQAPFLQACTGFLGSSLWNPWIIIPAVYVS